MGQSSEGSLQERIRALEAENAALRARLFDPTGETVRVPPELAETFGEAQRLVGECFESFSADPAQAKIEIAGERYVLVRAGALSYEFLTAIAGLYADRGEEEALHVGRNMLFDIAHLLGISDALRFHERMGLDDPIAKLSAGPVHFAFTGWAVVELLPGSSPTPDEEFRLVYNHPFSFEAQAWQRAARASDTPVCIMNAGYSSGWCEASFGLPLTAVEVTCRARGDADCSFVMAPPHHIEARLAELAPASEAAGTGRVGGYTIPTFFERKQAEERLQQAYSRAEASNQAKTEFLAKTSHELRTPLFGVIGMTDLLLQSELSDLQREYTEAVDTSARTLLALVNDLLDLSKVEAGRLQLEATDFALDRLLRSAVETVRPQAGERGLSVAVETAPDTPAWVRGDSTRVRQILCNFLVNAISHTPSGTITLRAEQTPTPDRERWVRLSVRDTGVGIPVADQEVIFQNFVQRPQPGLPSSGTGTGLGLPIVKKLAALMGGVVGLESEAGRGSTFWVDLPLLSVAPPTRTPTAELPREGVGGLRILIAEDNRLNQLMLETVLEQAGHEVTMVGDGGAAVEAVSSADEPYDLVLMDLQMPAMDGLEATRELRSRGDATPVVALTAHALEGFRDQCFEAGMTGYLTKPINPGELCQLVEKLAARV